MRVPGYPTLGTAQHHRSRLIGWVGLMFYDAWIGVADAAVAAAAAAAAAAAVVAALFAGESLVVAPA